MKVQYKGIYKDRFGEEPVVITNDFETLSFVINGVCFCGTEFSDFAIDNEEAYSVEQLKRFTFFPVPVYNTDIIQKTLCDCQFEVYVPQLMIHKPDGKEFSTELKIEYLLGKERPIRRGLEFEEVTLSLLIDDVCYTGTGSFFEIAFDAMYSRFEDQYQFKNCYGCMFGDYSIYGQSSFGTMRCFVFCKEAYLKATDKIEYAEIPEYAVVQEIYCCEKYEVRSKGVGYRG